MRQIPRKAAFAVIGAVVLGLGACETPPPMKTYPPISFKNEAPIRLNVDEITVVQDYTPPGVAPNVDQLFPVSPVETALRWGKERLVAAGTGTGNRAEYIVHDASVTETALKRETGLTALMTKEQAERYDARIAVELRIYNSLDEVVGKADAEAVRTRSIAEDATINDREQLWYDMTKDLMTELDRQLDKTIKSVLSPYVLQ
jgi:hypothetical protein